MSLPQPDEQARRFAGVREAHAQERAEDYVRLIAELIEHVGEARPGELAERLGVTAATVSNTLVRLKESGLIAMKPYRSVFLTPEGWAMARETQERHRLVAEALKALGVPEATAEHDAEGMAHHLSQPTVRAFEGLIANQPRAKSL